MKGNLVLAGGALRLYRPILIVPKASENKGVVNVSVSVTCTILNPTTAK